MLSDSVADVAVVIIGYRNPADIRDCLLALSDATGEPRFDVFICENGGSSWYQRLLLELSGPQGPCIDARPVDITAARFARFTDMQCLSLRMRPGKVWVGCAVDNLGYAGGLNAWLNELEAVPGWKGVWLLNPDTMPAPDALAALVDRAEIGKKGMVGSTIFDTERPSEVRCRGGLQWQKFAARTTAIGLGDPRDAQCDAAVVEAALDSPSGASMYVTRPCIEKIGNMDESYFLFFEDLDWGVRAKACGLGYAAHSMVAHKHGTTTGSAKRSADIPKLSLYLEHRNGIHFVRKFFPRTIPNRIAYSLLFAAKVAMAGSPARSWVIVQALLAALRGERGRPTRFREAASER
jgi:GT2 family glycosyltransferase